MLYYYDQVFTSRILFALNQKKIIISAISVRKILQICEHFVITAQYSSYRRIKKMHNVLLCVRRVEILLIIATHRDLQDIKLILTWIKVSFENQSKFGWARLFILNGAAIFKGLLHSGGPKIDSEKGILSRGNEMRKQNQSSSSFQCFNYGIRKITKSKKSIFLT